MPYKSSEAQREQARRWQAANPERKREAQRLWRAANPEKCAAYRKKYYAKHKEKHNARFKQWYAANPDRVKAWTLKRKYGLTLAQFNAMKSVQGNACAICGEKTPLVVDHDHKTGEVRGLVCVQHNSLLGMARDSVDTLQRAIAYLE